MIGQRVMLAGGLVGALILALTMAGAAWYIRGCQADRELADRPPSEIEEGEVDPRDDVDPVEGFSLSETSAQPSRRGRSAPLEEDDEARTATEAFAAAVIDSTARPDSAASLLPTTRFWRDGDMGGVAVVDSEDRWRREEYPCPEGRRFEAGTQDSTMFGNCARAIPSFLPNLGKSALRCAAFAGAGYGVAWGAQQIGRETDPTTGKKEELLVDPLLVGAAAGGGCVILEIVR